MLLHKVLIVSPSRVLTVTAGSSNSPFAYRAQNGVSLMLLASFPETFLLLTDQLKVWKPRRGGFCLHMTLNKSVEPPSNPTRLLREGFQKRTLAGWAQRSQIFCGTGRLIKHK